MNLLLITTSLFLVLISFHTTTGMECGPDGSYKCWNAIEHNVISPSHFLIDTLQEKIILTAKNSVCHISLDLSTVENVKDVSPGSETLELCTGAPLYEDPAKCHNFHHILLLPTPPSNNMMMIGGDTPLNDTVLECGSNAFQPRCYYRMRSNLSSVVSASGQDYVPNDGAYGDTTSLWLSTGRLISATQRRLGRDFSVVLSDAPFNGPVNVGTISSWFDHSVQFVSMYEIDGYIYTFFREEPDEVVDRVIYSRVSRVCKNDTGGPDPSPFPLDYNIFTTFLKARMTCVSGGYSGDIPFYYNDLQDTYLMESESETDGSLQRDLYAIFTSPENGPEGSALCVFSFEGDRGDGAPSLGSVFEGSYLTETDLNKFDEVMNPTPFTCAEGRTASEASNQYLMSGTALQSSGSRLHLQLTGYSFKKFLVTRLTDLSGTEHNVFYITATKEDQMVLLKILYDTRNGKSHIISELELQNSNSNSANMTTTPTTNPPVVVTKMQLLGNGTNVAMDAVFVGTTETLYRVPVADCPRFSGDCCACVAARDPHCAYDPSTDECVSVGIGNEESDAAGLIQSVVDGNIGVCIVTTVATPSQTTKPSETTEAPTGKVATETAAAPSPSVKLEPPSPVGVKSSNDGQNFLGTIVGSIIGFIVGGIIGMATLAFCVRYRDRFHWGKLLGSQRTTNIGGDGGGGEPQDNHYNRKGASDKEMGGACNTATTNKAEQFGRNNFEPNHVNGSTTVVHIDTISNLGHSNRYHSNGKVPTKGSSPPPYSPKKPTGLPSNGIGVMSPSQINHGETTPTKIDHSTPERTMPPFSPQNKVFPLQTPPQTTPTKVLMMSPLQTTPPSSVPLKLTPAGRYPYRRTQSQSQAPPPPPAHFATLPTKKRHYSTSTSTSSSEATPSKRPSSAEGPIALSLPRPSSEQNLNHAPKPRGVTTGTTPPKQRLTGGTPTSPFNAHHHPGLHGASGVPASPFGVGGSSLGTPTSTSSGSSRGGGARHFKFPPGKVHEAGGAISSATPPYWKGEGSRGSANVKATGYAVEPMTNQDRITYGSNMDPKTHTIDRKNKFQNGHAYHHHRQGRSPPVTVTSPRHPETTIVEVNGSVVGCTDC